MRRRWLVVLAFPAVLAAALPIAAANPAGAATTAAGWTHVASGDDLPVELTGAAGSLAYDAATGQVVLAGGTVGTWTWDGMTWTRQHPQTSPINRYRPMLGYDGATKQVVMFGGDLVPGEPGSPQDGFTDTWTWNGLTWLEHHPAHHPAVGGNDCSGYDEATGQFLMLAPNASSQTATWTWTGSDWTTASAVPQPSPLLGCSMTYDPDLRAMVALVPAGLGVPSQLWSWDGHAWSVLAGVPWTSGWLTVNTVTYDRDTDQLIAMVNALVPGQPSPQTQTWQMSGTSWSQISFAVPPGTGQIAADSATHQLVLLPNTAPSPQTWVFGPSGSSTVVPTRLSGVDRAATAVAVSQARFADAGSARAVVLARDDVFADALAGGPLAASTHGPLLLTSPGLLDAVTKAEIQRVLPTGGTVYLLGGVAALPDSVAAAIATLGFTTVRIAGADRFTTAVAIANTMGNPPTVFEASGTNFPDALSAVPAAVASHGVILLTDGNRQIASTSGYIAAHPGTHYAIGGPAATADPSAIPLVGPGRFATADMVALAFFPDPTAVTLASGFGFADALAGGWAAGSDGEPLLLVPTTGSLPEPIAAFLSTHAGTIADVTAVGGTTALGDDIVAAVAATLAGSARR